MMERPVGVTILAVLALIGGALAVLGGLGAIGMGAMGATVGAAAGGGAVAGAVGLMAVGLGVLLLLQGGLSIAFGVGALQLKPWAWMLGIICQGLAILLNLGQLVSHRAGGGIVGLAIAGVILWYLFQPDVKRAFKVA